MGRVWRHAVESGSVLVDIEARRSEKGMVVPMVRSNVSGCILLEGVR